MVIFNSYVKLPGVTSPANDIWMATKMFQHVPMIFRHKCGCIHPNSKVWGFDEYLRLAMEYIN